MGSTAVTVVVTPWYRRVGHRGAGESSVAGSVAPTPILDHGAEPIRELVSRSRDASASRESLAVLESAHAIIREEVRPVYALEERTPASRTLTRGFGSCSQRLAILESVARSVGVPTRVRGLLVARSFWFPRFPRVRWLLPDPIALVWPEFSIDGEWRGASELFGPIGCRGGGGFANRGSETLFEAVGRCAVSWDGRGHDDDPYDLSRFVRADLGRFPSRDLAFARMGQTLCAPTRLIADPILRRVAA
jgi:hypothetical protein